MTHYSTLGITKEATAEEIKKAYKKLASKHHPDKGGDTAKFQEVQVAYETLSDPQKRAEYDNPQQHFSHGGFQSGHFNMNEMFEHMRRQQEMMPIQVNIQLTLNEAFTGTTRVLRAADKEIKLDIPAGIQTGQGIQYAKLGPNNKDIIAHFHVQQHHRFARDANDLYTKETINTWDQIAGTTITVETIDNKSLKLTIPPKTENGSKLRLAGQGMISNGQRGDMYVIIEAKLPTDISEDMLKLIKQEQRKGVK
jgi:curved DNA-binding protein